MSSNGEPALCYKRYVQSATCDVESNQLFAKRWSLRDRCDARVDRRIWRRFALFFFCSFIWDDCAASLACLAVMAVRLCSRECTHVCARCARVCWPLSFAILAAWGTHCEQKDTILMWRESGQYKIWQHLLRLTTLAVYTKRIEIEKFGTVLVGCYWHGGSCGWEASGEAGKHFTDMAKVVEMLSPGCGERGVVVTSVFHMQISDCIRNKGRKWNFRAVAFIDRTCGL